MRDTYEEDLGDEGTAEAVYISTPQQISGLSVHKRFNPSTLAEVK
jgi:hypothetical protein